MKCIFAFLLINHINKKIKKGFKKIKKILFKDFII